MFLSLSTISPTNTRLRCVLSFQDQCLSSISLCILRFAFSRLILRFSLNHSLPGALHCCFVVANGQAALMNFKSCKSLGSSWPCSTVIGLPNSPLLVTVSAMCFANVSGSGHHISPLSSHVRCGICQPHRQGRHFQPIPQDHAEGGILFGLLKHQSASDLCFGLQVEDGW